MCVSARPTPHDPLLNEPLVPVQHECGITVSILRPVLCKRTTALTHMAGPSVAEGPGGEIIRGRTNVDDPAVPDRLVLCDPWWLKRFRLCLRLTSLAGWLNIFCLQLSPVL